MAISQEEVKHVAHLARIGITEEELTKFQKDLGAILDYVNELQEVPTDAVEPTSHVTGSENVMREDERNEKFKTKNDPFDVTQGHPERGRTGEKLIEAAPDEKDGYVKVKSVF